MGSRLKIGDKSFNYILTLSEAVYKKKKIDNKKKRAKQDIVSAKLTARKGLSYDRKNKAWEQSSREVKIEFLVKSDPTSYKKRDSIKNHFYPITFLVRNWDKGLDSAFRCRVGSLAKPHFSKKIKKDMNEKTKEKIRKSNKKIADYNIKKGIQMQFFFDSMRVYRLEGILWGVDYTNALPKVRNPDLIPFFSKHEYYIVTKILPYFFANAKLNQRFKNEDREDYL